MTERLMAGELKTTREAAELLRVHPKTLQRWRRQGTGPRFYRVNRLVWYREADLMAFVEKGEHHG